MDEHVNYAKLENEVENVMPSKEKREDNFRISKVGMMVVVFLVDESKTAIILLAKVHPEKANNLVVATFFDCYVTSMENSKSNL